HRGVAVRRDPPHHRHRPRQQLTPRTAKERASSPRRGGPLRVSAAHIGYLGRGARGLAHSHSGGHSGITANRKGICIMSFLGFLLLGLIAGAIAKLILPGKQGGGWFVTLLLGV